MRFVSNPVLWLLGSGHLLLPERYALEIYLYERCWGLRYAIDIEAAKRAGLLK